MNRYRVTWVRLVKEEATFEIEAENEDDANKRGCKLYRNGLDLVWHESDDFCYPDYDTGQDEVEYLGPAPDAETVKAEQELREHPKLPGMGGNQ